MAAAKLVTRCPACRTAFRLVADQLRLRQGLVRCGQCETVFDAREHLIEVPATPSSPAPTPATSVTAPSASPAPPASTAPTIEAALAHAAQRQADAHAQEAQQPFDPGYDPGYEVPALDSPTMMMAESETLAGYDEPQAAAHGVAPEVAADVVGSDDAPTAALMAEPAAESPAEHPTDAVVEPEPTLAAELELQAEAEPERTEPPEPTEATLAPEPWPTLDRGAFGDALDDAKSPPRAQAQAQAAGIPASGAYSARAVATPGATSGAAPNAPLPTTTDDPFAAPVIPSASGFLRTETAEARGEDANRPSATSEGTDATDFTGFAAAGSAARQSTAQHWLGRRHTEDDAGRGNDEAPYADAQHGKRPGDSNGDDADASGDAEQATHRDGDGVRMPGFAPDFLRHTRGQQRQREHKVTVPTNKRVLARVAIIVLAVGALLEATYLARSQLAGTFPTLRPLLEAACAPLHCVIPPWRDLDALRIDSSQLQKQDEATDVYLLAVTMRNQGRATTALPAIELVMTDLQDQLLLRRVLQPAEYLEPAQRGFATSGLRAGTELPVRVRFRTQQAAANYRVLIFYP